MDRGNQIAAALDPTMMPDDPMLGQRRVAHAGSRLA
jgi:hypothetical protein